MAVSGGTQYVRLGDRGPAVLLLHGFGDTGDMWVPLAEILLKDHTVIVPDLRGMGLSSHQDGDYEKTAQAQTSPAFWTRWGLRMWLSSPTTSATWSATRLSRFTRRGEPMGRHGCAASGHRALG